MKKLIKFFIVITVLSISNYSFGSTINELRSILQELMNDNNLHYSISLNVDNQKSGGFASIYYSGSSNEISVYVDSNRLRNESNNTWAFVMGHELGHKYLNGGGTPRTEWNADIQGSKWAVNSGYSVRSYVSKMLSDPDSCDPSHGCFHKRAANIARRHGLRISNPGNHEDHPSAQGPFPSSNGSDCRPQRSRRSTTTTRNIACTHYVQCQHLYTDGYYYYRSHQYDTQHQYDIIRN